MVKVHIKGEVGTIEMPMPYAGGFSKFLTTDPRTVKHILKDKFDNCKPRRPDRLFLVSYFPRCPASSGPTARVSMRWEQWEFNFRKLEMVSVFGSD